jgi:hypothetical protein
VSGVCIVSPAINPEAQSTSTILSSLHAGHSEDGLLDNTSHWLSILRQSGTINRGDPEAFDFPNFVRGSYGPHVPLLWFKFPLLILLLLSALNVFARDERVAARTALILCLCATATHFLAYTMVWEYHYTMLLVAVPFLLAVAVETSAGLERTVALIAFAVSLLLYLPTPYVLWQHPHGLHLLAVRLPRIIPALGIFLATTALAWLRLKSVFRPSVFARVD